MVLSGSALGVSLSGSQGTSRLINDVLSHRLHKEWTRVQWVDRDGATRWGIGLTHWSVGARNVAGHSGLLLGHRPRIGIDIERGRGVVLLTNAIDAPVPEVLNTMFPTLEVARQLSFGASNRRDAERYCGEFRTPWSSFVVACPGDGLVGVGLEDDDPLDRPDVLSIRDELHLTVVDGGPFSHVGQSLKYEFDGSGRPTKVWYGSYLASFRSPLPQLSQHGEDQP